MANELAITGDGRAGRTVEVDALTGRRLDELARMFDAGMARIEGIGRPGSPVFLADPFRAANAFERVSRALRQITVLERELLGLRQVRRRQGPKLARPLTERLERGRDPMRLSRLTPAGLADPDRLTGYSTGPLDEVVAGVRKLLELSAPADDPFAPDAERREAERKPIEPAVGRAAPAPVTDAKPSQAELARKAALLALRANPRKGGFRRPMTGRKSKFKAGTLPAQTVAPAPQRQGRGPPG